MIKIEHLYHTFTWGKYKKELFHDLTFSVSKGEILLVTGESGVGKTSLLKMLCGLQDFKRGKMTIGEYDVAEKGINIAKCVHLAYFPQRVSEYLLENTVEKELKLSGDVESDKIADIIEEFQIRSLLPKKVNELSGGEVQRVALASFFASDSDILLCDEPASYLDKANLILLNHRIQKEHERGKTIILTSGDTVDKPWKYKHLALDIKQGS